MNDCAKLTPENQLTREYRRELQETWVKSRWTFSSSVDYKYNKKKKPSICYKPYHSASVEQDSFTGLSFSMIDMSSKCFQKNCWSQLESAKSFSKSFLNLLTCSRASFNSISSNGKAVKSCKNRRARAAPLDMSSGSYTRFRLGSTCK